VVPVTNSPKPLRVYIDETGDRGASARSSPFFAFAAVMIAEEDEPVVRQVMAEIRQKLMLPSGSALHWNKHVKTYARRQYVTSRLGRLVGLSVAYVLVDKRQIPADSRLLVDHVIFYNYAAGLVLERVLLAADGWLGRGRQVIIRFGHVRGFDHGTTAAYFDTKQRAGKTARLPWHRLRSVHFSDQAAWDGLQVADQYAGMLYAAFHPNEFDMYEEAHFLAVRHQLRRDPNGQALGRGFKVLGDPTELCQMPWWPPTGL
jgi:hypothetical protein